MLKSSSASQLSTATYAVYVSGGHCPPIVAILWVQGDRTQTTQYNTCNAGRQEAGDGPRNQSSYCSRGDVTLSWRSHGSWGTWKKVWKVNVEDIDLNSKFPAPESSRAGVSGQLTFLSFCKLSGKIQDSRTKWWAPHPEKFLWCRRPHSVLRAWQGKWVARRDPKYLQLISHHPLLCLWWHRIN